MPEAAPRYPVRIEPNVWLEMDDGVRLAATLYLPDAPNDGPFPALLESVPYRKDDWTLSRDRPLHVSFAEAGYVSCRLDVRGTGTSQGIASDEYTEREIADNVAALAWLAARPGSSGATGMFGISWGGFSALQAAMRRPPSLRAIVPVHFSHDRYTTDVHYYGGTLHVGESIYWPLEMVGENALPPDPEWVGPGWRDAWLERLERTPQWPFEWLRHQRRDAYWRHGSAAEDWDSIAAATLAIGGLHDGYRGAVLEVLEHVRAPRRGVIGPWGHAWPHDGWPAPSIDGVRLLRRWWDRWLRDEPNGVDDEPMLAVYVQDPIPVEPFPDRIAGRWWFAPAWPLRDPATGIEPAERLHLSSSGGLGRAAPDLGDALRATAEAATPGSSSSTWDGPLWVGLGAPFWCGSGEPQGVPGDMRFDDAASLVWTSAPLVEPLLIVGVARAELWVSADRPVALTAVRLEEVRPDGSVALVARGALNLTHRAGHETPVELVPGEVVRVDVPLLPASALLGVGSRIRVAIAGIDWPLTWPSPQPFRLTLHHEPERPSAVVVPLGTGLTVEGPDLGEPSIDSSARTLAQPLPGASSSWTIVRDPLARTTTLTNATAGGHRFPERNGLEFDSAAAFALTIGDHDPLACRAEGSIGYRVAYPGGPTIRTQARLSLGADARQCHLAIELEVTEDDRPVFARSWRESVPRDLL